MKVIGLNEYQYLAQRTSRKDLSDEVRIMVAALGLCGESGEVADMVKKHKGQAHDLNKGDLAHELGDIMWYVAEMANAIGYSLEDICTLNVQKLMIRYPQGFDADKSINREDW